jgi:pectinesterase
MLTLNLSAKTRCLLVCVLPAMIANGPTVLAADGNSPSVMHDVVYGSAEGRFLRLDVTMPGGSETMCPGVILVHGGGWSGGDRTDMQFLAERMVRAGFTCFSVGYRLAPEHRWPSCLEDVREAVRWVKSHSADYRADPERIVLLGYSAGGHLACHAAVTADKADRPAAVVLLAAPIDHEADSERRGGLSPSLQKLLNLAAVINDQSRAVLREISPVHYVSADLPPFVLVHGTEDTSVPFDQSLSLRSKLMESGVSCALITLEGAGHRIAEWETYDAAWQDQMIRQIHRTLADHTSRRRITVRLDGSGDFSSVQSAVDSVAKGASETVVIRIAPGVYKERVIIPKSKPLIRFAGEDAEKTVLTYDLSARMPGPDGQEIGTFKTPSVIIEADDFVAENITFENSAGAVGQALAIAVLGDRAVFRKCRFLGWQDTIYDQSGRHYYEDCYIAGHCDFIFGGGTAFFERCRIHCLEGSFITAASTPAHEPYGYVFSNCTITGEPARPKTYLGRPWRDYANVIFLNTQMEGIIRPEGWHNWSNPEREKTARYAEFNSTGAGANPAGRVSWSRQLTAEEAGRITPQEVLRGTDGWNPVLLK